MPNYCFVIYRSDAQTEDLGGMALSDDGAALAFGNQVIRDMIREDPQQCAGWVLDITDGERAVGSVTFDLSNPAAAPSAAPVGSPES